jgi:hypothetical protein
MIAVESEQAATAAGVRMMMMDNLLAITRIMITRRKNVV